VLLNQRRFTVSCVSISAFRSRSNQHLLLGLVLNQRLLHEPGARSGFLLASPVVSSINQRLLLGLWLIISAFFSVAVTHQSAPSLSGA
jgi:hypothetical protein